MNAASLAVIVTTYNRPQALQRVLQGLAAQSRPAEEIIVADDGSRPATAAMIEANAAALRLPVAHVWHEDRGFRAGAIRNRAVAAARGDYLVFLDGDCIPGPRFLARHAALAAAGRFVTGNRVLLSAQLTETLLRGTGLPHTWGWPRILGYRLRGELNRLQPLLTLPPGRWRDLSQRGQWRGARSCNLGLWRADFEAVEGFDEHYTGWGHEDADLAVRLLQHGVRRRDGRWGTAVWHLWHAQQDRSAERANWQRLQQRIG